MRHFRASMFAELIARIRETFVQLRDKIHLLVLHTELAYKRNTKIDVSLSTILHIPRIQVYGVPVYRAIAIFHLFNKILLMLKRQEITVILYIYFATYFCVKPIFLYKKCIRRLQMSVCVRAMTYTHINNIVYSGTSVTFI